METDLNSDMERLWVNLMHIVLDVTGGIRLCIDNSSQQCKGVFGSGMAWHVME
jgi:hypothetical protein